MQQHFSTLARYNRWANRRLYEAVAALPDADYRREMGAFFGSLRGTLNHLLVADRIWLQRITGEGTSPARLDEILHDDFPSLREARAAEDERIIRVVDGLGEERLAGTFGYRNLKGQAFEQELAPVLAHFFNHQTHHRGQAHTLLTQLGRAAPELDLIYFLREQG
ncbi:DinB family protein [Benzoatithermus flavus]|uniref:DinB family protein n=1 Tax=Benzoatithermus flavus TaxID=3108223 RepID=A0ABU8XXY5_9PROT